MSEINEALESEINKEMAEFQNNKGEMIPTELLDEAMKSGGFDNKFKAYAERHLTAYNKYLKSKAATDELKSQSDAAEFAMINFAKELGVLTSEISLTYDGMATFKIKEKYFGNVTKENKAKVYSYFKSHKRESEFFEIAVRKGEINKYVRNLAEENKAHQKHNKGGVGELILPDGITLGKKHEISLSNKNSEYGI